MSHKNNRHTKKKRSEPPTLADIVREKNNNGDTIVQFYLDVANGKLDDEGFEACHRRDAAMQIHAIAPELVAEAIARLAGVQCGHAERRTKSPIRRSREDGNPSPDANRANAARRHEALEYLASALAAPSLADDPRVAGIVRESTDQGKTVVSFLMHVMHGVVRGFRPRQRVEAAKELLAHIARDELARTDSAPITVIPAEAGIQGGGAGDGSPSSRDQRQDASPSPQPSPAPAATGLSFPSSREPIPGPAPADVDPTVIPAEACPLPRYGAGIQDGGDGDDAGDPEDTDTQRGCYDIDRKITEAQRDPAHPIHKFVQAYDEVAAAFHREDKENDDDEELRYWISGEVPDSYGKYIWEYAPAYPRSIRKRLRPRRGRSRSPGTAAKGESIWVKRPTDRMREAGIPRPNRAGRGQQPAHIAVVPVDSLPRTRYGDGNPSPALPFGKAGLTTAAIRPLSPAGEGWSLPWAS